MNVKEYIASGIVESYVLGIATEAERQEFESLCRQYPEIAEARTAFELALEKELLAKAPPPPVQLRPLIMEKIAGAEEPAPVTVTKETPIRRIGVWKWLAAASLVLLAGTAYWAFSTQRQLNELQQANRELRAANEQTAARLQTMESDARLLQKPEVKMAAMKGTLDPNVYATIYWDTASKDVYLMVNNLPKPASDKQYQLWALLDGQPIDLGMIEARQERLLYRMKNVQNAQAFAITLERKGGSPTPTTSPVVLSKL